MGFLDLFRSSRRTAADNANLKIDDISNAEAMRLIDQGNTLETEDKFDEALQCYDSAIRLAPWLARAYLNRGNIYLARGEVEAALSAYDTAIQKAPDYAAAHFNSGNAYLQSGQTKQARAAYKQAIALNPDFTDAYVALGCAEEDLEYLEQAVENFRKALVLRPDYTEVHVNLGNVLKTLGENDDAIESYRRALEMNPDYVPAISGLTDLLQTLGKKTDLLAAIQQVIERAPDSAEAHNNLGIALLANGQFEEALESHHKALNLAPNLASAHQCLGNCLQKMGRLGDAVTSYRKAIELDPRIMEAYSNLGNLLMDQEQPDEAAVIFGKAITINPDLATTHFNLGTAYNKLGKLDMAEACFNRALKIDPDLTIALNNLGACLNQNGRQDAAVAVFRRALELDPNLFQAQSNLGLALRELGRIDEAIGCFKKALEIKPDFGEAEMNLALAYSNTGQLDKALAGVRRAMNFLPDNISGQSALIFLHNYLNDSPPSTLLAEAKRFGEMVAAKAPSIPLDWDISPEPDRCLRVGLVSGDLRRHPVGFFIEGVLTALASQASQRLQLFAYSSSFQNDAITERIKACCDSWHSITGISDEVVCHKIRDDQIDILIDLSGHTLHNRLPAFAWKPSPVQVTWLGYFATTGVEAIDYLIADPWTLPESEEKYFTEKIIRLPETRLCFTAPDEKVNVAPLPALSEGCVTFGCFNTLTKMNDQVVALWSRILKALPNSRLILMSHQLGEPSVLKQTIERFREQGIDEKQLMLKGFAARANYLAAYNQVDIALDPFPYCGGTTTVEALWMGVPVLTLAGEQFLSRQGVGLLMNAGLPEWVATDPDDYMARAISHACNLQQLASIRSGLREKVLASPVFDAPRFATHFEVALRSMWKDWCAKQLPE